MAKFEGVGLFEGQYHVEKNLGLLETGMAFFQWVPYLFHRPLVAVKIEMLWRFSS